MWSPYHYSVNNPIMAKDGNGYFYHEINNQSERHNITIPRGANEGIAGRINYEFFNNWQTTAPNVANHVQHTTGFVQIEKLGEKELGRGEVGGNAIWIDKDKATVDNVEGTIFHEIGHNMGGKHFAIYGAMVSLGYMSRNELANNMAFGNINIYTTGWDEKKRGQLLLDLEAAKGDKADLEVVNKVIDEMIINGKELTGGK